MKLNAGLSLLSRGRTTKQACRVCHENAELKTEALCAVCAHLKARIHLHITQQPADGDSKRQAQRCTRSGCLCAPCGQRILDPHPLQPRADGREIHFHPRCHTLWLEAVQGVDASSSGRVTPEVTHSPRLENP
jgi:hypothetical protein